MAENSAALVAIAVGTVLFAIGYAVIRDAGGLGAIQGATSRDEFVRAAEDLDGIRRASTADILILVPGYMMWTTGLFALFWTSSNVAEAARITSIVGSFLVLAAVVADQVENLMVRLGLGNVEVHTDIEPSGSLLTVLRVSYILKYGFLAAAGVSFIVAIALWLTRS